MTEVDQELGRLIEARYPIIYVITWEEARILERIQEVARLQAQQVVTWRVTSGVQPGGEKATRPAAALRHAIEVPGNTLFVFHDLHVFLHEPEVVRALRDVAEDFVKSAKSEKRLIILAPVQQIPVEVEKEVAVLDYPLPDHQQLGELLDSWIQALEKNAAFEVNLNEMEREQLIGAASGLTLSEADRALRKAILGTRLLNAAVIGSLLREKEQIIRKTGVLEFFAADEGFQDIGGLTSLKTWLRRRSAAFLEEARRYPLPDPKGLLLIGVPGCGKSLVAKAVAAEWQKPLLRLDIGRVFGGVVGASEENIRKAIRIAEGVAPCILWMDEIEKGFAGAFQGGDSGVSARVLGTLMTWMQEKTKPVFIVATANDISRLPPELTRKGRFDEIFFVDLPLEAERKEIFSIHLSKRNRKPADYPLEQLAKASTNFSGSEIEQAVISALYEAFDREHVDGLRVSAADLGGLILKAIEETTPLAEALKAEINAVREWSSKRARMASAGPKAARLGNFRRIAKMRFSFVFRSGERAGDLPRFQELCRKYPDEAMEGLVNRRVEDWLRNNDFAELAGRAEQARQAREREFALDEFLGHIAEYEERYA